jgi:hypothetical protein
MLYKLIMCKLIKLKWWNRIRKVNIEDIWIKNMLDRNIILLLILFNIIFKIHISRNNYVGIHDLLFFINLTIYAWVK